jgi:hypothetical protein
MKPAFRILLLATSFLFVLRSNAQDEDDNKPRKRYEHYKERSISKSYPASGNTLNIENSFGHVKIIPWDKNEIKVDIHIEASSTHKELMEASFERIDVTDKQTGNEISFVTTLEKGKDKNISCNNCSNTMGIDYEIHMPTNNKLIIKNSFGHIIMPDYSGSVILKSSYGKLRAGKLSKVDKLEVEFGRATIKEINNTDMHFSYSSLIIDNLSGSNKIKMDFCPYSKIILDKDLISLTLNDSYSVIHLQPVVNFSASYDISTSYGSLVDKTNANIKRTDTPDKYGPDLDKHYEGKSGSGAAKITIKSSFGSIMIGEGSESEMKAKNKTKTRI